MSIFFFFLYFCFFPPPPKPVFLVFFCAGLRLFPVLLLEFPADFSFPFFLQSTLHCPCLDTPWARCQSAKKPSPIPDVQFSAANLCYPVLIVRTFFVPPPCFFLSSPLEPTNIGSVFIRSGTPYLLIFLISVC